ncbi:hypothetical protein AC579_7656 [Pseudocercospora musae]|uniref:Uncharacterized protein n=1 Tax=Pseudocercospora musae TaxID=113226 RepID=A0A139I4F8_9PEZI|nr:hypothetical protein AC579_7656 [Pseudocercospora musae]
MRREVPTSEYKDPSTPSTTLLSGGPLILKHRHSFIPHTPEKNVNSLPLIARQSSDSSLPQTTIWHISNVYIGYGIPSVGCSYQFDILTLMRALPFLAFTFSASRTVCHRPAWAAGRYTIPPRAAPSMLFTRPSSPEYGQNLRWHKLRGLRPIWQLSKPLFPWLSQAASYKYFSERFDIYPTEV